MIKLPCLMTKIPIRVLNPEPLISGPWSSPHSQVIEKSLLPIAHSMYLGKIQSCKLYKVQAIYITCTKKEKNSTQKFFEHQILCSQKKYNSSRPTVHSTTITTTTKTEESSTNFRGFIHKLWPISQTCVKYPEKGPKICVPPEILFPLLQASI